MQIVCPYCQHADSKDVTPNELVRCTACQKVFEAQDPAQLKATQQREKDWQAKQQQRQQAAAEAAKPKPSWLDKFKQRQVDKVFKDVLPEQTEQTSTHSYVPAKKVDIKISQPQKKPKKIITEQRIDFGDKHFNLAYRQIVIQGKVQFPDSIQSIIGQEIHRATTEDTASIVRSLLKQSNFQPLDYPLFERCVELCQTHDLYPYSYQFLRNEPQYPVNTEQAASFLTVAQLKKLLKQKGHSATGKRADIERQAIAHLKLEDFGTVLETRFADAMTRYTRQYVREQYTLLISTIVRRSFFLHRISKPNDPRILTPYLSFVDPACAKLATLLDGTGYDGILIADKVKKSLPLFPGDEVNLSYETPNQRKSRLNTK